MITPLTTAEEQLMQVVWELQGAFLKDIVEAYPEPKPHQNTISTFLKILVEKGFISTEKEGRIFFYKIEISKEEYELFLLKNFVETYYTNNKKLLIERLLNEELITTKDLSKFCKKEKKKKKKKKEK